MMSPHQLLECRIQPKDRPILALDHQIIFDAALGRDVASLALVEKVGALAANGGVMILETPETLNATRLQANRLRKNVGDPCYLDLVESILAKVTLVDFTSERSPWDNELFRLGPVNILYFRLVTDHAAELLVTNNQGLLRANKDYLQQDPNLGRITTPANCLQFLNTLEQLFQLNQAV